MASAGWVLYFKKKQVSETWQYISGKDNVTFEGTVKLAELFKKLAGTTIPSWRTSEVLSSPLFCCGTWSQVLENLLTLM
jgi:hypothetical protein